MRDSKTKGIDYHYCYYGTNVMYHLHGGDWVDWKYKVREVLLPLQKKDGCEAGSWAPNIDPWGDHGGRVYSTAICVLCLETPYRFSNFLSNR